MARNINIAKRARIVAIAAAVLIAPIALAEFGLSAARGFNLPTLPYYVHEDGAPRLPENADFSVAFGPGVAARYRTDAEGARIGRDAALRAPSGDVRVIGDSQALGYGIAFEETFAAIVADRTGRAGRARIHAAPGADVEVIAAASCGGAGGAPLQIIALNLGNDLDEMYIAGQARRSLPSSVLGKWLAARSQLYASFAIYRSRRALARHPLPGLNPILFNLDAGERIVIAREAVRRVSEIIACTPADKTMVLILPSDFQVDPEELGKYAAYSAAPEAFDKWYEERDKAKAQMDAVEDYILRRLATMDIAAVSFRKEIAAYDIPSTELFDRHSHHLTAKGHAAAAQIIIGELQ